MIATILILLLSVFIKGVLMDEITIYSRENPIPQECFAELYEIMEYSFPPTERGSSRLHQREFERERFRSLCMPYELNGGKISAFMNYYVFDDFVFLEHFAVARELRGKGIGSKLVQELLSRENKSVVLEAEPASQSDYAARRIAFYQRLGFNVNPYVYYQPAFSSEYPAIELVLLSCPKPLAEDEFVKVRNILYKEVYRINPPADGIEY